jgi:hypothetical protein
LEVEHSPGFQHVALSEEQPTCADFGQVLQQADNRLNAEVLATQELGKVLRRPTYPVTELGLFAACFIPDDFL